MRCLTNQQWLLGAEMAQRPNFRPNQPLIEFLGIPGLDEGMDQEILEISELGVDYRKGLRHTQDMTTTQTPNTIKFNRDGNQYTFTCDKFTANVWKFESAYGDTQWGCDITHTDDRMRGTDAGYQQFDFLADARLWIASLAAR